MDGAGRDGGWDLSLGGSGGGKGGGGGGGGGTGGGGGALLFTGGGGGGGCVVLKEKKRDCVLYIRNLVHNNIMKTILNDQRIVYCYSVAHHLLHVRRRWWK